mgnify:CR=1 FL=1
MFASLKFKVLHIIFELLKQSLIVVKNSSVIDGKNLEQITYDTMFDAFPVFSNDGKKLVFSSNRNNGGTRSTNLFISDWVE